MRSKNKTSTAKEEPTPPLVPKLRFPEFRGKTAWRQVTLSSVAQVVMGSSPRSEFYNESQNGLPLIQGNADINNRLSAPRVFTSEITKECQIGNILMSVRAPVGTVAKSVHHACIGRGIAAISANNYHSQEFLYQWLLSYEPRWIHISQGGTFDAINSEDLRQLSVTTPTLPEQQKIAACLTSVDELIAAQARKVEALKAHKKGLMQQLFPREGETQPRLRFPEFRGKGEWEEVELGEKVDLLSGYPFDGSDITQDSTGIPLLRGINVTEGRIRHNLEIDRYYKGSTEGLDRYKLRANDLVIGMDGSKVGKNSALVSYVDAGALLIQRVARLRVSDSASIQFIFQRINSSAFHSYVDRINTSSGIPHISAQQIKEFRICFPSIAEQNRIASCLSTLDDLIVAETQKLEALKMHKKGLMQQLFPSQNS